VTEKHALKEQEARIRPCTCLLCHVSNIKLKALIFYELKIHKFFCARINSCTSGHYSMIQPFLGCTYREELSDLQSISKQPIM